MNLKFWILSLRYKTLGASFSPVIVAGSLAYSRSLLNMKLFLCSLLCALLIQIGTNLANDYYDFIKGANLSSKESAKMIQSGIIKLSQIKTAFIIVFLTAILIGIYLVEIGKFPIFVIGVLSICLGILYTAGSYALAYIGYSEFFVIIFFGPVAACGTYYIQTLKFDHLVFIAGLAPGFLSCALLVINNLRDMDHDKIVGKKTLAVRFGGNFAKFEYLFLILATSSIPVFLFIFTKDQSFLLVTCIIIIFSFPNIRLTYNVNNAEQLNKVLSNTGGLLFLL